MSKLREIETLAVLVFLISQSQFDTVRELLRNISLDAQKVLSSILAYTPPLTSSSELLFLEEWLQLPSQEPTDIPATFTEDQIILDSFDLSPELLESRVNGLLTHCEQQAAQFDMDPTLWGFIKARAKKLDSLGLLQYNDPLFVAVESTQEFKDWKSLVLSPLQYLRSITRDAQVDLSSFEKLETHERAIAILRTMERAGTQHLSPEFIHFLRSLHRDVLIQLIQSPEQIDGLLLLNQLIKLLFSETEDKDTALKLILNLFYNYESPNTIILESMFTTLDVIKLSYTSAELTRISDIVKCAFAFPLEYRTLQDIHAMSFDKGLQLSMFESVVKSASREEVKLLLSDFETLRRGCFPDLDNSRCKRIVLEKLLSLKLYDDVDVSASDEPLIIEHFWSCFKAATNGSKERGELLNAYESLSTIHPQTMEIQKLTKFVDAVDELFHYSIHFKRSTPFKPVDLLTVDLASLVQKILELNDCYDDPEKLCRLLDELSCGLPDSPLPSHDTIKCLCIDSSLAQGDFEFAYGLTLELMKSSNVEFQSENWYTWFQVGKYVSPEWLETEIPENVITKQMSLLSEILFICPVKHAQVVITQWKSLDMELSLRDEPLAPLDNRQVHKSTSRGLDSRLARALSSTASDILKDGNGAPISKLLTSGLGWAIGSRNQ